MKWRIAKELQPDNYTIIDYTFLSFFIFDGGHRPFFLILRFRKSLFLRSLIFLASFILNFCSSLNCSFDSNGRFSTDTASSDCSGGVSPGSPPSFPSVSDEARAIKTLLSTKEEGEETLAPLKDLGCGVMFLCNLRTKTAAKNGVNRISMSGIKKKESEHSNNKN